MKYKDIKIKWLEGGIERETTIKVSNDMLVRDIIERVITTIKSLYQEESEVVFEEFIECAEVEIEGLPLNLQVYVFARLKDEIDGDEITINVEGDELKLIDYLQ